MTNLETFLNSLEQCKEIADSLGDSGCKLWQDRIDELIDDVSHNIKTETLQAQWTPFFENTIKPLHPKLQNFPNHKLVFGYTNNGTPKPNRLSLSDINSPIEVQRGFDPETTDLEKLIAVLAEELAAQAV